MNVYRKRFVQEHQKEIAKAVDEAQIKLDKEKRNRQIAKYCDVIGHRQLEIDHHPIGSVINQEARRCLVSYTTALLNLLKEDE